MSDHYYSKQPKVESNEEQIEVELRGMKLRFYTDSGVFSKRAVDFGTQLLLQHAKITPDAKVLDMGCGYGPIGITLAKESGQREIIMADINERAVALAKKNASFHGLKQLHIVQSDLFASIQERSFNVILTNPPIRAGKQIVHRLFEEGVEHLSDKGELWVVIQKKQGAPSAFKKLEELFEKVNEVAKNKGYWIIRAIK